MTLIACLDDHGYGDGDDLPEQHWHADTWEEVEEILAKGCTVLDADGDKVVKITAVDDENNPAHNSPAHRRLYWLQAGRTGSNYTSSMPSSLYFQHLPVTEQEEAEVVASILETYEKKD